MTTDGRAFPVQAEHGAGPRAVCLTGKLCLRTRAAARTQAARAGKEFGRTIRWYKCQVCRWFHLTHMERA